MRGETELDGRAGGGAPNTVESDGVTVRKEPKLHDDQLFKVTFTITSESDVPIAIRLVDHHPDEGGPDEVGFHPDYDPNNWEITESGDVAYEAVIDPGCERVTVYGFRVEMSGHVGWLLDAPSLVTERRPPEADVEGSIRDEEPDPPAMGGERDPPTGDEERDATAGIEFSPARQSTSIEASGDDRAPRSDGAFERDVERGEGGEEPAIKEATDGGPPTHRNGHGPHEETGSRALRGRDGLIEELLAAFDRRELREEERAALRAHLGLEPTGSVEVRLRHVQEQVADLTAYRDAFERFLDETGEPPEIVEEFRREAADLDARIESFGDELSRLSSRLDGVEGELESLAAQVGDNTSTIDAMGDLDGAVESIEREVDDVGSVVEALEERHASDVERIEGRQADTVRAVKEAKQALSSDVSELRETIAEWQAWREHLSGAVRSDHTDGN